MSERGEIDLRSQKGLREAALYFAVTESHNAYMAGLIEFEDLAHVAEQKYAESCLKWNLWSKEPQCPK